MIVVKAYSLLWLVYCGYDTFKLLKATSYGGRDTDPPSEDLVDGIGAGLAVLSPKAMMGITYAIILTLISMDASGLALVFAYPSLGPCELAALSLIVAAVIIDDAIVCRVTVKAVERILFSEKSSAVLARYLDRLRAPRGLHRYAASYGKLSASLYLVLWCYF